MIYVGPWEWHTEAPALPQPPVRWRRAPAGARVVCDLGGQFATLADPGLGLFEGAALPGADYDPLGEFPDETVPPLRRSRLAVRLATTAFQQTRLDAILFELLTLKSDPTGQARWYPLMPQAGRLLGYNARAWEFGVRVPTTHPSWQPALELLRKEYARMRRAVGEGRLPPGAHLRQLSKWIVRHGLTKDNYLQFLGSEPDEGTLPPQTQFTDSFGGDLSLWTQRRGTWQVLTGRLDQTDGTDSAVIHAASWAGGADYFSQSIFRRAGFTFQGIGVRRVNEGVSDSNRYVVWNNSTTYDLHKRISGGNTVLDAPAATINTATDYTFKIKVSGSRLDTWLDGATKSVNITDTALSAAGDPFCLGQGEGNLQFDDFLADDEAAAAGGSGAGRISLLGVGPK